MLAAPVVGPRQIQLKEVEYPSCGPRSILVDVKATGICGSDLKFYQTPNEYLTVPRILGHEITGVVVDKGKEATRFDIGARIVVNPMYSCGTCQICYEGRDCICPAGGLMGRDVDGGFVEYMAIDEKYAFNLPDSLPYAEATQIQTLTTVYHGQRRLQLEPGKSALVIGLGATGLLHVQLAKASGATPLVVLDPFPWKLELAKDLGADVAIRASDNNVIAQIRNATRGTGPDAIIEAVGIPSTVALSVEAVAPGGKILLFGNSHDPLSGFDSFIIYFKEINLIGTRASSKTDWEPVINLVESGKITLEPLITHHLAFKDVKKGFMFMDKGEQGLIRAVVSGSGD